MLAAGATVVRWSLSFSPRWMIALPFTTGAGVRSSLSDDELACGPVAVVAHRPIHVKWPSLRDRMTDGDWRAAGPSARRALGTSVARSTGGFDGVLRSPCADVAAVEIVVRLEGPQSRLVEQASAAGDR